MRGGDLGSMEAVPRVQLKLPRSPGIAPRGPRRSSQVHLRNHPGIRPPLLEEPPSRFSDHENLFLTSVPFMPTLSHCHEHEKLDMPKRARVPG